MTNTDKVMNDESITSIDGRSLPDARNLGSTASVVLLND